MAVVPIRKYEAHVRLWTDMLRTFIGCSEAQVARWAAHFKDDIADENSMFYNQPPEYYVAENLIPQRLERNLETVNYVELKANIQGVLQDALESAKTIEEIDWQPAKQKIAAALAKYGETLANVAEEKAGRYRD